MPKREELTVITKTYDLILWSCNHTSRFPRSHRFVLGERIERNLYELLETLLQAKYQRERSGLLDTANLKLEILRFQMRLAKDLQCFKHNSYQFDSKAIDEPRQGPVRMADRLRRFFGKYIQCRGSTELHPESKATSPAANV